MKAAVRVSEHAADCCVTLLYLEGLLAGAVGHRTVQQQAVELCGPMNLETAHGTSRDVQPGKKGPEDGSKYDSHGEQTKLSASLGTHYSTLMPLGPSCSG